MTKPFLNILFCDDDNHFARTQTADFNHRLIVRHGILPTTCIIQPVSNLAALRKIAKNAGEALQWDAIFCDLGWGDQTMEGIQMLHDIKMNNPRIFTVLFTAQDENEFINQALEWKMHFVDRILKVSEKQFFNKAVKIITDLFYEKDQGHVAKDIRLSGTRILPTALREPFVEKVSQELKRIQTLFSGLLQVGEEQTLAVDIQISTEGVHMKLQQDPADKKIFQYQELIDKIERFPSVEAHDLLPLSKVAYIEFVKKKYGTFPQMAEATGLDLNNLYRVSRRFKETPFIIFKVDTIREIIGSYEAEESNRQIRALLCSPKMIRQEMQKGESL